MMLCFRALVYLKFTKNDHQNKEIETLNEIYSQAYNEKFLRAGEFFSWMLLKLYFE